MLVEIRLIPDIASYTVLQLNKTKIPQCALELELLPITMRIRFKVNI